jgi:hypothetical protein
LIRLDVKFEGQVNHIYSVHTLGSFRLHSLDGCKKFIVFSKFI